MKAMLKSEFAEHIGVTTRTLSRWCLPHHAELKKLGWTPHSRLLSPKVVQFLSDLFCVEVP